MWKVEHRKFKEGMKSYCQSGCSEVRKKRVVALGNDVFSWKRYESTMKNKNQAATCAWEKYHNHDVEKRGSKVFPWNGIWIGNQQFLPLLLKFPRFYAISKQINASALWSNQKNSLELLFLEEIKNWRVKRLFRSKTLLLEEGKTKGSGNWILQVAPLWSSYLRKQYHSLWAKISLERDGKMEFQRD